MSASAAPRLAALPPLALYVHLPWCVRKCPYCDFNSHEHRGELPEDEYIEALFADVEGMLPQIWGRRMHAAFLGGGTPSLFSPAGIDRLLAGLRARLTFEPDAEITMEANPGTFEIGRFRGFRAAGVNRLSIGVQSFAPAKLAALGRIHSGDEARRAIEAAVRLFPRVNIDLMYGLPGQHPDEALADLETGLAAGVTHVSSYQLAIEPNTVFHARPPALPAHDDCAAMQDAIEARLAAAGFEHYETSAFARPGERSRHNLNYWRFGDYLGIGAGAHGKISHPDRITRHERAKQPREYLQLAREGRSVTVERTVGAKELPFEFMLNALRLVEGVEADLFMQRTGLALAAIARPLALGVGRGLLEADPRRLACTPRGRRFLNEALELFL